MSKDSIQQRMAAWMADYEETGLQLESMKADKVGSPTLFVLENRLHLVDSAYEIMSELYTEET